MAAAVIHAGWNALAKRASDPLAFLWCAGVIGTLVYLPGVLYVLACCGLPRAALPFVAATILLHAVYFWALGRAYHAGDLSVVYPIARGLGVMLVPALAFAIFGERLSPAGLLGVALVVLGVFVLHWRRRQAVAAFLAPGTGWACVTGLSIAGYSLVDKAGVARLAPLAYIGLMELGASLVLLPAILDRREAVRHEWRTRRLHVLAAAVLSPGAYLLVLFAFQLSKAAYVVAGREVSIVFSALIGTLWMREGHLAQRLLGAVVVAAGVVCVALAR